MSGDLDLSLKQGSAGTNGIRKNKIYCLFHGEAKNRGYSILSMVSSNQELMKNIEKLSKQIQTQGSH